MYYGKWNVEVATLNEMKAKHNQSPHPTIPTKNFIFLLRSLRSGMELGQDHSVHGRVRSEGSPRPCLKLLYQEENSPLNLPADLGGS